MRKRLLSATKEPAIEDGGEWIDLNTLAEVEITSEDPGHPIESALLAGGGPGWRAGTPGRQVIRLLFSPVQRLTQVQLRFEERETVRTQQYALRWLAEGDQAGHEIVRQQYNFSPGGAAVELENHQVDLDAVAVLELTIEPDIGNPAAFASLERMRVR
ncbi:MAG: carbohydrate-binding protein [Chromatiales bacterium]|nr:carbohydrate-binding protein [Chromatiales bacterium]